MSTSTWEERQANLKKQAKFKAKNPHYGDKYAKIFPDMPLWSSFSNGGTFRIFELGDPRDIDLLPRIIGYMPLSVEPVWARFWELKDVSQAPWAAWLRELEKAGLEPVDIVSAKLGVNCGLPVELARGLCKLKIAELKKLAMEGPKRTPFLRNGGKRSIPWLLRDLTMRRVKFRAFNGSIHKPKTYTRVRVETLATDYAGRTWFDN
jgi:hypothetical protein